MKTFDQWAAEARPDFVEETKGKDCIGFEVFQRHHIPMVVSCTACEMTMAVTSGSVRIDGLDMVYCESCASS